MALDEASQQFVATMAEGGGPALHEQTPAMARLTGPIFASMSGAGPEVGEVTNLELDGDGGQFRVRVLRPKGEAKAIIVYYHGGGWVLGDIDLQYDTVARHLVDRSGCTVVMVNYRKAPEYRFPVAVDDSYAALEWVDQHRGELAVDGAPLIVAGDSAGGNLSAVMTQRSRDRSGPKIDFQVLVYPVTDCDMERGSYNAEQNQLILAKPTMEWFFDHYEPDVEKRKHPDLSPIRHENLADLPPAFVLLAECDPLHDEGREYAEKLQAAGNEVALEVADGQMHAFFQMANVLPGYEAGMNRVVEKIDEFVSKAGK
ncbi:alpha/beta hydrolase [Cumulibacter soli]|uniref:alpha/beta hydrolase n=1 Tax=Cumulibacter soli TaxID=2546344 RepID=UPI001067DBC2|nr:alpha/beta hydrolase [Cumulibacter soli]